MSTILPRLLTARSPAASSGRTTSAWPLWTSCPPLKATCWLFPARRLTAGPTCPKTWLPTCSLWHKISGALDEAFDKDRVALMIAGFDVPHTHIHLFPADSMAEYDPANAKKDATAEELDAAAEKVRSTLRKRGHGEFVPEA